MSGTVRHNEPMAKHTSWRLGGPADIYFRPRSREELQTFLADLDADLPVYWFGLGSNVLVRDGGIRGVVVAASAALNSITHIGDGLVEAEAGVACTILARNCVRWKLGPAEFFAGIPGTMGGALKMNAGAFGGQTWDNVVEVQVITRSGEMLTRKPEDFEIGYRETTGPDNEWFIAARFQFATSQDTDMQQVKTLMDARKETQPLGLPSCGSVFRNPPGDYAARLIEDSGLKGHHRGGARISEKHANFIINTGDATAADIESLIQEIQQKVQQDHDVLLQLEVHVVGETGDADATALPH